MSDARIENRREPRATRLSARVAFGFIALATGTAACGGATAQGARASAASGEMDELVPYAVRVAEAAEPNARLTVLGHWLYEHEDQCLHGDAVTLTTYLHERVVVRAAADVLVLDCAPSGARIGCIVHEAGAADRIASVPSTTPAATAEIDWEADARAPCVAPR